MLIENKKLIRPKDINLQISKSIKIKEDTSWKEKVSLDKSISYFYEEIEKVAMQTPTEPSWFFSGYDCDSLALDNMTNFASTFINFFSKYDSKA